MYQSYLASLLTRVHSAPFQVGSNAPETIEGLHSLSTMYVFGGASEHTIYGEPSANHLFRAWHDSVHLAIGADFQHIGESRVAREQARLFGHWSDFAADMIYADVFGQVLYMQKHGVFPTDQRRFVENFARTGKV